MGFLEKLFGRKQSEEVTAESGEKIFSVDTASDFIKKKYDESFQSFKDVAKDSYEDVQTALKNLRESLSALENANISEDVDSTSLGIIIPQRKSFIKKMEIMINHLSKPLDMELDSIMNYQNSSLRSINEADQNTVKEFSTFEGLFKNESKAAFKNFRSVFDKTKKFIDMISEKRKLLSPITDAQDSLGTLKNDIENFGKLKNEIDDYNKRLLELSTELKSEAENLKKLESGDEFKIFDQLVKRKEELESDISEAKLDISQNFFKINRPLRKFQHLLQQGKEKIDDEKAFGKILDSPVDFLIENRNFEFVNSVLEKVSHAISSGLIDMKDGGKAVSEIKLLIDHDVFEELVSKHDSLSNELRKIEKEISGQGILKSRNELESHIEQLNRESKRVVEEITKTEKRIENMKASIQDGKTNMERILSTLVNEKITMNIS